MTLPPASPAGSRLAALPEDPAAYERHPLHDGEQIWTETNCYVDLWVELLHSLGLEPVAGAAFTLSTDFEGDQWTFSKFPPEDLRRLYGIDVTELNVWRPVLDHVEEQLGLGRLLTVEVDAWYLPDTEGVSYRRDHVKTTLVPVWVDRQTRRMRYFHNAGYFALDGEDFDGVYRTAGPSGPDQLPPYVETVRLERVRPAGPPPLADVVAVVADHLSRRPADNPVVRLGRRIEGDVAWLTEADLEAFHLYAFGTCRQCGASAELAAALVMWLAARVDAGLAPAAGHLRQLAEGAKALQFALARASRGRTVDLAAIVGPMAEAWEDAMAVLAGRLAT